MKIQHQRVNATLSMKNGEVTLTYDESNVEILREELLEGKSSTDVPSIATNLSQENDKQVSILKATLSEGETREVKVLRKILA